MNFQATLSDHSDETLPFYKSNINKNLLEYKKEKYQNQFL